MMPDKTIILIREIKKLNFNKSDIVIKTFNRNLLAE